jgi:putative chitobiose transport system substrate-binding protein
MLAQMSPIKTTWPNLTVQWYSNRLTTCLTALLLPVLPLCSLLTLPRRLVCLIALAFLASVFALPRGHAKTPREGAASPRELVLWTMQLAPFHNDYMRSVLAAFEAANPNVRVKWVDIPWSEMERKTLAAIAAGTAPDVVNLNPQFSAKLAEFGALADPEAHLAPAVIAQYLPSAWNANRLAGRSFAIPWYVTTHITLINRDMLAAAQVSAPTTWDELLPVARQIRTRTGQYAYFPALDGSAPLEMAASLAGTLLTPDQCRPAFTGAAGRNLFETYRTLYAEGLAPKTVLTEGHRSAVAAFLAGQVAMISTGMQFLGQVRKGNPQLYARIEVKPQLGGAGTPPNLAVMNLAVPEATRDRKLAFALATFVTRSDWQRELAKRVPILPSTAASYADPFFTQSTGDSLLDAARQISIAQVRDGVVLVPPLRNYNRLRTTFIRPLQATIAGRTPATAALAEIEREWTRLLACPQRPSV